MSYSEADFQAEVIVLCQKHSVKYFHSTDSRKDLGPGFPDLVLVGIDGIAFVELKVETGTLSSRQVSWRYNIKAAGGIHHVWRPSDLRHGRIESFLSSL